MNLFYYIKAFGYNYLPKVYFKKKYQEIKKLEKLIDDKIVNDRLDYYFKIKSEFEVPSDAVAVKDFKRTKGTTYYLDLKEFLHYFNPETKFVYYFGDETHVNDFPTLFKARPIYGNNENSILFKLNKRRHFIWADDKIHFHKKLNKLVWRGSAYQNNRIDFVKRFYEHPFCNVGQTNKPKENVPWQREFMSIKEQLKYKFIFCPEGNDVATGLKWLLSSNSLCFMPKPKFETWFMEGKLKAGIHYVEIDNDFSNLERMIEYYSENEKEALEIISNAQAHAAKFFDRELEDLLCFKVLEKYAKLSNQSKVLKFV